MEAFAGSARLGVLLASVLLAGVRAGAGPNVVLFVSDDQGWTGSSVAMNPALPDAASDFYETPQLERLASEGMRFSEAYSPAPSCSPTRASLLTGLSPAALQITDVIERAYVGGGSRCGPRTVYTLPDLPTEVLTIAEAAKAIDPDYVTGHFGKWHLGGGGPGAHGFDEHDGSTSNAEGNLFEPGNPKDIGGVSARAESFMQDQVLSGRPFFLQISHYAVHTQIDADPATIQKYDSKTPGVRHDHPEYAAMTENLDSGLGRILDAVHDLGIEDTTYVIYVSDHGAADNLGFTNNLPLAGGKATLLEGGTRVPMVVRGPGIDAGTTSSVPVIGWDVLPTVLDWIGGLGSVQTEVEGGSLRSLLESAGQGQVSRPREELVWHFPHYVAWRGTTPQSAIRVGDMKLIRWFDTGEVQLFDLASDPGETLDLANDPANASLVTDLTARLSAYLAEVDAQLPAPTAGVASLGWELALWLGGAAIARRAFRAARTGGS